MIREVLGRSCITSLVALISILNAGTADAQIQATSWTPVQEGLAITAVLGRAATTSRQHASFDLATRVDIPVHSDHLVRLEAARASWRFEQWHRSGDCCSGGFSSGATTNGVLIADDVTTRRVTLSLIRRHIVTERSAPGGWTPLYAGGGIGAYHFRPLETGPYVRPWRWGVHGIAGMEFPLPESRIAITGEVQVHVLEVSGMSVLRKGPFVIGSASLGLKFRM